MLEFAIGSSVLMATFAGTFQFGYTFLQYNNLENAVSRGARYASLAPYDSATSTPSAAFLAVVQNMVLYGSTSAGSSPVVAGLGANNVRLTVTFTDGVPAAMTVAITGYTIPSVFGSISLADKPGVTFTYQGIWAPI